MRALNGLLVISLVACVAAGCGGPSRSGMGSATTAPNTSAQPTQVTSSQPAPNTSTTTPWQLPPSGPLTPALRADIASAFAPQLRFNAWHNDGNASPQNRSEDFFPQGITSFLRELESGQVRVVIQGSSGASPGISELRPFNETPTFGGNYLGTFPRNLVGDPPGQAPIYTHVYEDPSARLLAPDGSGELRVYAEYWVFYPQDRAEVPILGIPSGSGAWDFWGHRGDWEHVSYRIRVYLSPRAVYASGVLEAGYYHGHGTAYTVPPGDLIRVGDHPVVFVGQGKHSSYPQAGEWRGVGYPTWAMGYTEFFRGNGVWVDTWSGPLLDLEDPTAAPAAFASPEFQAIVARSPGSPSTTLTDWTLFGGRWGPDQINVVPPSFSMGSPTGPKSKATYGDLGGSYSSWSDLKASQSELKVYSDLGITIPLVRPAPAPTRR